MKNPESQFFTRHKPDYSGMNLAEKSFCQMEDYNGIQRDYKLDIITPQESCATPLPVVLFVHGGGFVEPCDKRQAYISLFARLLALQGYAVVSPDYPLFPDTAALEKAGGEPAGYDKAARAVNLACKYIQEQAEPLGLDRDRLGIIGGSAGGWASFHAIARGPSAYKAFVNLWGVPQVLPALENFPPVLSVHGTADALVPYQREQALQGRLEKAGIPRRLIALEGSGHTPLDQLDNFFPALLDWLDVYVKNEKSRSKE